jgi:hypothetical protein
MVAHIIGHKGHNPCPHASLDAKVAAKAYQTAEAEKKLQQAHARKKQKTRDSDSDDMPHLTQQKLKVFRGINVPFSKEQEEAIALQACRAAISVNGSFDIFEDPEMLKLFRMFRSAADDVLLSGKVLGASCWTSVRQMLRIR